MNAPEQANELAKLVDTVDVLVAKASTTSNEEEKKQYIKEALFAACLFLTKLERQGLQGIRAILEETPMGAHERGLPLTDLIARHEELAPFREFGTIKSEFRSAMSDLLEKQGRLTREKINEIMEQVEMLLPQIVEQETGAVQLKEKFQMLKRLFCRSADDGPPKPPDPAKPPPSPRGSEIREWLNTIAEYLKMLVPAANLFVHTTGPMTTPPQTPSQPTPIVQPWHLKLLGLLGFGAFATWLDSRGHIPPETPPQPPAPAVEKVDELELVGAGAD